MAGRPLLEALPPLPGLTRLRRLELSNCRALTALAPGLDPDPGLPGLRVLRLDDCQAGAPSTRPPPARLTIIRALDNCPRL